MQDLFKDFFNQIQNPASMAPPPKTDTSTNNSNKDSSKSKSAGSDRPVKSDPLTAIATSLFSGGGKSQGAMPGLDWMGDFNSDSFISSTLGQARQSGGSGSDFTKLLGSLIGLL